MTASLADKEFAPRIVLSVSATKYRKKIGK